MGMRLKGKPVDWIGSSRDDLKFFPDEVQQAFGFGLYRVQLGELPPSAKPLKGNLTGVYELRERYEGNAYRVVYIAKLKETIYVLNVSRRNRRAESQPRPRRWS